MATGSTRRTLLKGVGGGLLAALGLARARGGADADNTCKPAAPLPQSKCTKDAQCCDGLVCQATAGTTTKRCQSGCRIDGAFYASGVNNPANPCQTCQPGTSTTAWTDTDCSPFACDPVTGTCFSSCAGDEACVSGAHCVDGACCPAEDFCEFGSTFGSGVCCDPGRSPTAACCEAGGCCECFHDPAVGFEHDVCCEQEKICGGGQSGWAPGKLCCHNDEDCVNGDCCHVTFHCADGCCDRPCCGDVCCAQGTECVNETCVAEGRACDPDASENPNCLAGESCILVGIDPIDGVCCDGRQIEITRVTVGDVEKAIYECCPYGSRPEFQGGAEVCCPAPDSCSTSRGSITRP